MMKNLNIFIPVVLLLGGLFAYGVPEKAIVLFMKTLSDR